MHLLLRVWHTTLYVVRMHDFQYARNLATTGFFERSTRYRVLVRITYFLLILYRPISQSNYTCKMQIQSFVTYCMLAYCIQLVILEKGEFIVDVIKVFSKNVKAYRMQLGLSQEHFAEKAGLHRTYISAIECGKRSISLDNIQKIADALQIDTYLLFIDQENFNQKGGEV